MARRRAAFGLGFRFAAQLDIYRPGFRLGGRGRRQAAALPAGSGGCKSAAVRLGACGAPELAGANVPPAVRASQCRRRPQWSRHLLRRQDCRRAFSMYWLRYKLHKDKSASSRRKTRRPCHSLDIDILCVIGPFAGRPLFFARCAQKKRGARIAPGPGPLSISSTPDSRHGCYPALKPGHLRDSPQEDASNRICAWTTSGPRGCE